MNGELSQFNQKDRLESITFFVETIIQMKKTKKSKSKIDVFAIMAKELNDRTPVKQHSGHGLVKDSDVARIQDIYKGDKKDNG
jgi:hypothetical protein